MKNRVDLIKDASKISCFTQADMEIALDAFIQTAKKYVISGEDLNIAAFGRLCCDQTAPRKLYDINNGGFVTMPSYKRPKMKFSDIFREEVKNGLLAE